MTDASVLASSGRGHTIYDRALFFWAAFVFTLAVLLGGGTRVGLQSDALLEMLSVPLLVAAGYRLFEMRWERGWILPVVLVLLAAAVPLLQLVPLPPAIWTAMPGRDQAVEALNSAGVAIDWRPLSLAPFATTYAFLSLIPATALFLFALQCSTSQRYALLIGPLALAGLASVVGVGQFVGNRAGSFVVQDARTAGYAIGFFANRNHFAALIYASLPFAVVWTARQARESRGRGRFISLVFGGAVVLIQLVGLSSAYSRAGIALGIVSLLGSAFIIWRSSEPSRLGRLPVIIAGAALLVVALVLQIGLIDLLIQRTAADSARQSISSLTLEAIRTYWTTGAGFGTFVPIFQTFERPADILVFYINHAHNDWLELTLEGGVLAIVLMLVFVIWFGAKLFKIWLSSHVYADRNERMLLSAASLSMLLLLLHSLLDYPLRTITLMAWFAFGAACLCAAPAGTEREHRAGRTRERRRSG